MPITTADAEAVGYEPKELIVNLVAKALLSEHDEDKAKGYVAFVRDALEAWFTNDQKPKSDATPVYETDQLNQLFDLMSQRDELIHRFAEEIKQVVLTSCDNLLDDANAIRSLRTDIVEGALPVTGPKKQKLVKQIKEEYEQRMLQLDEMRKVLVTNMEVMAKFKKSQHLLDEQRQLRKVDRYCIEKWTKTWAEQRKKAGGPTCGPNGKAKGAEEKTKERWEFEAKKWSQECAMFAVFNEFLLSHLADSHASDCLQKAAVARQDIERKEMEKRMKITENVIAARHHQEMETLKKEHEKALEDLRLRLNSTQAVDITEEHPLKTIEKKQEDLAREINKVFIESLQIDEKNGFTASHQAEMFKNFEKQLEKENRELAKGDKQLEEKMAKIKAIASSQLYENNDNYKLMYEKHQKKITITSHGDLIKNEMMKIFEKRLEEREKKQEGKKFEKSSKVRPQNAAIPSKSSKKRAAKKARQQQLRKAEQSLVIEDDNDSESDSDSELQERKRIDYRKEGLLDVEEMESEDDEIKSRRIAELERKLKEMSGKLEESEQALMAKDRELSIAQTGFLRRGLGLSRGQMERKNGFGMVNGVNRYM